MNQSDKIAIQKIKDAGMSFKDIAKTVMNFPEGSYTAMVPVLKNIDPMQNYFTSAEEYSHVKVNIQAIYKEALKEAFEDIEKLQPPSNNIIRDLIGSVIYFRPTSPVTDRLFQEWSNNLMEYNNKKNNN